MTTVTTFSGIKQTGDYMYNNVAVTISEITNNGRLRGSFIIDGKETTFSNSAAGLKTRIDNGGKNPTFGNKAATASAGSYEKTFRKLQAQLAAATTAFAEFQLNNSIITLSDAQAADAQAAASKQASNKRAKKQAARRTEDAILQRIRPLRKWAKSTGRLLLFQSLTDKMLEITE